MDRPVRIGIVGCGSVMQGAYMPMIERLAARGLAEAVAACDVKEDARSRVRERWAIARFSTDYREIVAADEVDLVLVLTSMPEHGPVARAALQAGKHVLVEKPMAVDLSEAAELVALARHGPGILLPAPHVILSPTFQAIARRIHRGEIGRVFLARALYGHSGPGWGPWFYRKGGGALFDLGVYNVTSLTGLLGPVRRVTAMTGIAIPERVLEGERVAVEAEDNAHVLLDFGNSLLAVVTTGFTIQQYRCPAIEIYGSRGTIQMLGDDWDPDGYELWQNEERAWRLVPETDPGWPWTDGLRHLVECIRQGTRSLITPEHGYHVLEVMLKAQEAGGDGQARDIESTFTPPSFAGDESGGSAPPAHDRTREGNGVDAMRSVANGVDAMRSVAN
jgi:predicted dehydrogenase